MENDDLTRFYQMMDNLYPNQPKLNNDQKRFWYLAFKEYDIESLVRCLHEHTKSVERGRWRPEISDIMKYLSQDNSQLEETWQMFFDRKFDKVQTGYGKITVKRSFYKEKEVSCKPEYEECRRIAAEKGIPVKEVYNNIMGSIVLRKK